MKLKIVVIGGGSSYTPELMDGIIKTYSELPVSELVMVDIKEGERKLNINEKLIKRMAERAGLKINIHSTLNRREALKEADFVVTQFRVGGLNARAKDEAIPLKYNVIGQETTGPGGFFKALRTIPVILDICRDMKELCPEAWLVNFTNPSGIITEAVLTHSDIKCVGLCNVPINMVSALGKDLGVDVSRLYCNFVGLNHLNFINKIMLDGNDITYDILESDAASEDLVKNIPNLEYGRDFVKAVGAIPSPYLKYFYYEKHMLEEELEGVKNGSGTRANAVMKVEEELFKIYMDENLATKPEQLSKRGGALYSEAAVSLIDSIWNNRSKMHVVNTLNKGAILDLPEDCVVETNCIVNKSGIYAMASGHMNKNIRGLIQQAKCYEQLTIEAAVEGDRSKAIMAMVCNPLVHDERTAELIFDEMLQAHREYLQNFFK